MKKAVARGFALALLLSGFLHAQQPQQSAPGSAIRGAVTAAAGRPVGSVWVVVLRDTREAGRAVTADDGRYYVGRLSPGSYTVLVKRGESVLHRGVVALPRDAVYNVRIP